MKIIIAESVGYCYGVERALRLATDAKKKSKDPIYTLGPIIHNPQAVDNLTAQGIQSVEKIDDLDEKRGGILVVRSHGIGPDVVDYAKTKGIKVVDATCPFVKKAQKKAAELVDEGYDVFIIGERNHPEVVGILAHAKNKPMVVEELSDIPGKLISKAGIVVQTTQSIEKLQKIVSYLLEQVPELKIFNTICDATIKRQSDARKIAGNVDIMLVIGGKNSANTARLAEICTEENPNTFLIETDAELDRRKIKEKMVKAKKIGVTTGASTPDWQLKKIIEKIEKESN